MWMLFHRKGRTRAVADGESFVQTCPDCGQRARFHEVEVTDSFGVFFVDVIDDKERAFRCGACGELFDLKDRGAAAAAKPTSPAPPTKEQLAALEAQRRMEAARQRAAAEQKAIRIEDELAELKKRLGRA